MPFNSEALARAVAASPVPVVTGIGHEPDTAIADMVSDLRASTPTAAAEAVAPSVGELRAQLDREARALGRALQHRVARAADRVARVAGRPTFCDPFAILGPAAQAVDFAGMRLRGALPARLLRDAEKLGHAADRMTRLGPGVLRPLGTRLALATARLEDLSPLAILARGYSASFLEDGRTVLRSGSQVVAGDRIVVRISDSRLKCTVNDIDQEG